MYIQRILVRNCCHLVEQIHLYIINYYWIVIHTSKFDEDEPVYKQKVTNHLRRLINSKTERSISVDIFNNIITEYSADRKQNRNDDAKDSSHDWHEYIGYQKVWPFLVEIKEKSL